MLGLRRKPPDLPFGANVVGYLEAELGVAEVARQMIGALDHAGVPLLPIALEAPGSRHDHRFPHVSEFEGPFAVNLMCVNADQTPAVAERAGSDFFSARHTIGLWWWEISTIPDFFVPAFDAVDEVWAASTFIADSLRAVSGDVPVTRVPLPIAVTPSTTEDRQRFGFDPDEVLFLFMFDFHSIFARKNPIGLIDAFLLAFPEPDRSRLIIKSINGEHHPDAREALRTRSAGRGDIILLEDYLTASDRDALMASCDCYVSLHRSEGFGLTCAEAMAFGKPVIATAYSGSADYMLPAHSLPVGSQPVAVGPGSQPYPQDAQWAEPDIAQAAAHMRAVASSVELRARLGAQARTFIEREHSPARAGRELAGQLERASSMMGPSRRSRRQRTDDERLVAISGELRAERQRFCNIARPQPSR